MEFVDLKKETLIVAYNGITYEKEFYKSATTVIGVDDETQENWNKNTPYKVGEYILIPELKSIFRATADNEKSYPLSNPTKWTFWSFINSWNMFACDENIGSVTSGTDIVITLDFNQVNTLCLVDCDFIEVEIKQINNDTQDETIQIIDGKDISCSSFSEYCYTLSKRTTKVILDWMPNSRVTLSFKGPVKIGTLACGVLEELGATLVGSSLEIKDNSKISTNEFTSFRTVNRRGSINILKAKLLIDNQNFNYCSQVVRRIISKNVLWLPTNKDNFSEAITIGYLEKGTLPISKSEQIEVPIQIIGIAK